MSLKKIASYLTQILVIILLIYAIGLWQGRNLLPSDIKAPPINLKTTDGVDYKLTFPSREKYTILYFFAPWCSICKMNIANLNDFESNAKIKALAIALSYEHQIEIINFKNTHELVVPILLGTNETASKFKVDAFPTIYILDSGGLIVSRLVGYTSSLGIYMRTL